MAATKAAMEAWFAGAPGRAMNPDNAYGLQCKDVADDYCVALFGNWQHTIRPTSTGAKDSFDLANPAYFEKIRNNPSDPNLIPQRGDIIVWGWSRAVPEGHIAVVEIADATGVHVIQQDGYLQYPARSVRLGYQLPNGAMVIGWLRPKWAAEAKKATAEQIHQAYREILERPDGADPQGLAHYRNFTLDFVRADLLASDERKRLEARKAAEAKARAEAEARAAAEKKAAEEAEQRRLEEERRLAEERAAQEEADRIEKERLAKEAAEAEDKAREQREIKAKARKEAIMTTTSEQQGKVQELVEDVAAREEIKELLSGVSKRTKLIVYIIGDTLIGLGLIVPSVTVAILTDDPLIRSTSISTSLAAAGAFVLTMFGIYKSGSGDS